jgi:Holliday junction resolvasome RuvABC DNA-binding subunit
LGQVPGVSTKLAQDIIAVYPTLALLIDAMRDKKDASLTDITGIGPKKARTLMEFMLPEK